MKKNEKTTIHYGRLADRSLEAYKEFVSTMMKNLTPGMEETVTEEEWKTAHAEFWAKADATKKK